MKSAAVHLSGAMDSFDHVRAAGERVARWLGFDDGPALASAVKSELSPAARSIDGSLSLSVLSASASVAFPLLMRLCATRFYSMAVSYGAGGWRAEVTAGDIRSALTFYGSSYSPEAALCAAVCAYLDAVEADGAGGAP